MQYPTIKTVWEIRTYDVWGNAKDGYQVNETYRSDRGYPIRLKPTIHNVGTPHEFASYYPTDTDIRRVLDCPRVKLDIDGDDVTIYINRARDGYPIGEMHCVSHSSLSGSIVAIDNGKDD